MGAEKHPGETWHDIPAKEHAARAVRHLSMWLAGDRSDKHIINASMRCMMAWVMEQEESKKMREIKIQGVGFGREADVPCDCCRPSRHQS